MLWALDRGPNAWTLALAAAPVGFLVRNGLRLWRAHRLRSRRRYGIGETAAYWFEGEDLEHAIALADVREVSVHHHGRGTATVVLGPTSRAAEVLRRSSTQTTTGRAALAPAFEGLAVSRAKEASTLLQVRGATGR